MSQFAQTYDYLQGLNDINQTTTTKTYVTNVSSPIIQTSSTSNEISSANFVSGGQGASTTTYEVSSQAGGANLQEFTQGNANINSYQASSQSADANLQQQILGNAATSYQTSSQTYEAVYDNVST